MGVWTNADKPEEAAQARRYGAEGIGLCRTEHMFREGERLEIVRDAILVASQCDPRQGDAATPARRSSADEPGGRRPLRRGDGQARGAPAGRLRGHLQGDGRPAGRHPPIDPPLHEFLPNLEEQLVKVTRAEATGGASEEDKELLATIKSLHEQNPMLGLRGCRLGLMIPDFVKIQTRAILNAADRGQEGRRQPDRQDHDPARRPRERARRDAGSCSRPRPKAVEARPASRSTTSSAR